MGIGLSLQTIVQGVESYLDVNITHVLRVVIRHIVGLPHDDSELETLSRHA
jgi:hypothetical protein